MIEGAGAFRLAAGAVVGASGSSGNEITAGEDVIVDRTPLAAPTRHTTE